MKVIGYVRVSTEEQAQQGVSLAAQEAKLRQYVQLYEHDKLELVDVVVDAGQSAKSLNRPGLANVLAALESGAVDGVIIYKMDRLTRSVRDLGHLLETYFQKHALISVQEKTDTSTASGRLVLNLLISVSQWEREVIGERTRAALQYKKSMGIRLGAPPLSDPATLARVRELRASGFSMAAIAQTLTEEGFQTKRGGQWQPHTIKKILDREAVRP
ncbi:MAG: recombinase family protein [Candidatus Eremiobacteraeota bacterium]|nr:recombinase family protein [Candidatus Eremiobacteraeota bacterium]